MRITDFGLRNQTRGQRGVSLIAAIFIIVVLAFMGVMFVSLISTGSFSSINDLQSTQALSVAEGGVEYEQRILAQNVDWYRSTDPVDTSTQNLGPGAFTASSTIPATMLQKRIQAGDNAATVYSTNRFPSAGYLQIEDAVGGGAEFVQYTGVTAVPPYRFTGLIRGRTVGSVATAASSHPRGSNVYPVATLSAGIASICTAPASITVATNAKFLTAGTIDILGEEIVYTGLTINGATMTLTGIQRCAGGTASVAANAGDPVTPVLDGGVTADNQAEIISTGTVGAAVRTVKKTVQR